MNSELSFGHKRSVQIVVEGFGSVVELYYEPAFRAILQDPQIMRGIDLNVTFVDRSEFWRGDNALAIKMGSLKTKVEAWDANYLDKSDAAGLAQHKALVPDYVIVATPDFTHVDVALEWYDRDPRPKAIFIEKPLSRSLKDARRLIRKVGPYNDSVLAFDHYRARLLPTRDQARAMFKHLEECVAGFEFYFLEDHSGADSDAKYNMAGRDGPIENEGRVKALNDGVILDGLPHMIALLAHFGRPETMSTISVRAGQYTGADGDPDRRTEIDRETFAAIEFVFADHKENRVKGAAYVGKGVRGVKALNNKGFDHNTKLMKVTGANKNSIHFDLRSSSDGSKALLLDKLGHKVDEFSLFKQPYKTFLEKIVLDKYLEDNLTLPIETGKRILEVLDDMRDPIPEVKSEIGAYPGGMRGKRPSRYIEDILSNLPLL